MKSAQLLISIGITIATLSYTDSIQSIIARQWSLYGTKTPATTFPFIVKMTFVNNTTEPMYVIARHPDDTLEEKIVIDPWSEAAYAVPILERNDIRTTWVLASLNEDLLDTFATDIQGNTRRSITYLEKFNKIPIAIMHFVPIPKPPSAKSLVVLDAEMEEDPRAWSVQ